MMNPDKQHKALEELDISYDLYKEIQQVIFTGQNNADDTAREQSFNTFIGFNTYTVEWLSSYTATVESELDSNNHSVECKQFFKEV